MNRIFSFWTVGEENFVAKGERNEWLIGPRSLFVGRFNPYSSVIKYKTIANFDELLFFGKTGYAESLDFDVNKDTFFYNIDKKAWVRQQLGTDFMSTHAPYAVLLEAPNKKVMTGKFREQMNEGKLTYDQFFVLWQPNKEGQARVDILDFNGGDYLYPQTLKSVFSEGWGASALLEGWIDVEDWQFVGDFFGRGYDQVLFINRHPGDSKIGKVMIVDYSTGTATPLYFEPWGKNSFLDGWLDVGDVAFSGDFMNTGHDQMLFLNKDTTDPFGEGRVMIIDYKSGQPIIAFYKTGAQSAVIGGWVDWHDLALPGDFVGTGHNQLLLVNNQTASPAGEGRVLVADFSTGEIVVPYAENIGGSFDAFGPEKLATTYFVGRFLYPDKDSLVTVR